MLDQLAGDWGPTAVFDDLSGAILGDAMNAQPNTAQGIDSAGLDALVREEGFSATPYPDHKGYSIGHGHLIKPGENLSYVTPEQARDLLLADVAWAESAVRNSVGVALAQSQFNALVMLAYNIGAGAFKASTLVRRINAGDPGASSEFGKWINASGQRNAALVARRERERDLFELG